MVAKLTVRPIADRAAAKREGWYRGVKLQALPNPPKTPMARLREAVRNAVAKNADALAGRK